MTVRTALAAALAVPLLAGTAPARAVDTSACEILLCAIGGFPLPACAAAHVRMVRRVLQFKSPFPTFGQCWVDDEGNDDPEGARGWTVRHGPAAKIRDTPTSTPRYELGTRCTVRDHNDGGSQNRTNTNPPNCVSTVMYVWPVGPEGPGELMVFPEPVPPPPEPGTRGADGCIVGFDDDCNATD